MSITRICGVILRNLYTFRRNYDRWFDAFYWPAIDLVMWGITSSFIAQNRSDSTEILFTIVAGLTFWYLVIRSQYETNVALLEDIWSRNLINIFVSPITFYEWLLGVISVGIIKASITFVTAVVLSFTLYKINILSMGITIVPYFILLLMTGWWISFLIAACIFRFGVRVQTFAWTLSFLLVPFSGVYYPLSVLPGWAQEIGKYLPTSYVFEGIRQMITQQVFDVQKVIISFVLNIIYLILSIVILKKSFTFLLRRGVLQAS